MPTFNHKTRNLTSNQTAMTKTNRPMNLLLLQSSLLQNPTHTYPNYARLYKAHDIQLFKCMSIPCQTMSGFCLYVHNANMNCQGSCQVPQ
jgi:hypothetical protein